MEAVSRALCGCFHVAVFTIGTKPAMTHDLVWAPLVTLVCASQATSVA